MSQPKEIFVRPDRCMGCNSCQLACAVEHSESKSLYGAIAEYPQPKPRIFVEWVQPENRVPVVCRHCEDAPCMYACIAGAIASAFLGGVPEQIDEAVRDRLDERLAGILDLFERRFV